MSIKSSFVRVPSHRQFNYIPRYYDKDEDERKSKRNMTLERGAFFKNKKSPISGAFTDRNIVFRRERNARSGQMLRLGILTAMICIPIMVFLDLISLWIGVPFLVILLLLFIVKVNSSY